MTKGSSNYLTRIILNYLKIILNFNKDSFDEGVIKAICNSSSNTPRIIDRTMDYALLIADKLNPSIITKEIIQKAIEQTIL